MALTNTQSIIFALVMSLIAFWLGRNIFLWFAISYFTTFIAPFLLLFRHAKSPRQQSPWLKYRANQFKRKFGLTAFDEEPGDIDPDKPAL